MRALITGIAGFAGSHLADLLLTRPGFEVHGVSLPGHGARNIEHILDRIHLHGVDLAGEDPGRNRVLLRDLLEATRPDYVYHLAAQASIGRAWSNPAETLVQNVTMQLNLLQAITEVHLSPRILVVGSADEYGLVRDQDLPIGEDTPLRPLNPYAVSKIAQDYLGYQYHLSHGLPIVRVRPFNHIGPRQGPGFVVPDFARQIASIEAGLQEPLLHVGNLSARRDFSDVRDIVRGYELALMRGKPGEVYNLGSGHAYSIQQILDWLLQMSQVTIRVAQDTSRMRPSDVPVIVSDSRRFRGETGWKPEYDLATSLADVLRYWREQVQTRQEREP